MPPNRGGFIRHPIALAQGHYRVTARFDPRQEGIEIQPGDWIERSHDGLERLRSVFLRAEEDGAGTALMYQTNSGCSYRLLRPEAFAAERAPVIAPFHALLAAAEPGIWIEGSQTGPVVAGTADWPLRVRVNEANEDFVIATVEMYRFPISGERPTAPVEIDFLFPLHGSLDTLSVTVGRLADARENRLHDSFGRLCNVSVSLDAGDMVLTGAGRAQRGCIETLRLPLAPAP